MKLMRILVSGVCVMALAMAGCQSRRVSERHRMEEHDHLTPIDIARTMWPAEYQTISRRIQYPGWSTRGEVWINVYLGSGLLVALQERSRGPAPEYRWRLLLMKSVGRDEASGQPFAYEEVGIYEVPLAAGEFAARESLLRDLTVNTRPLPLSAAEPLGTDGYHMIVSYYVDGIPRRAMSGEARNIFTGLPLELIRVTEELISESGLPWPWGPGADVWFREIAPAIERPNLDASPD